jgi:signal transduction histidine kinase
LKDRIKVKLKERTLYNKNTVNKTPPHNIKRELDTNNFDIKHIKRITRQDKETENIYKRQSMQEDYESFFLTNISHEIRTPLNVLYGMTQLIELQLGEGTLLQDEEKLYEYTGTIKQNCYRLMKLLNNIIDIVMIDMGHFELNEKSCDIVCIIKDITMAVANYFKNQHINITFTSNIDEKIMYFDSDNIKRVMLNLFSNAVKSTGAYGKIEVSMRDIGTFILISVKDDGKGISQDKMDIIFNRFRKSDESLNRDHEGSGLGLYIAKSIVELHDGKIWAECETNKGCEFYIMLPVKMTDTTDSQPIVNYLVNNNDIINIEFSDIYF